jgi:molybdopterin-guanine dinucleotide biosynthesis protein A
MTVTCSGIILSGGLNSRMKGKNKAYLKIDGARFLDRVAGILRECFNEILLVTKEPAAYTQLQKDIKIIKDISDIHSPLSGIHAGLSNTAADFAFCIGCDTPFLKREVVEILVQEIEPRADIIVPYSGTYYQPLCAIYSKRCAPLIEAQLSEGDLKVDNLFAAAKIKTIPYEAFQKEDKELISFFNVNSPEDLQYAEQILPAL